MMEAARADKWHLREILVTSGGIALRERPLAVLSPEATLAADSWLEHAAR